MVCLPDNGPCLSHPIHELQLFSDLTLISDLTSSLITFFWQKVVDSGRKEAQGTYEDICFFYNMNFCPQFGNLIVQGLVKISTYPSHNKYTVPNKMGHKKVYINMFWPLYTIKYTKSYLWKLSILGTVNINHLLNKVSVAFSDFRKQLGNDLNGKSLTKLAEKIGVATFLSR